MKVFLNEDSVGSITTPAHIKALINRRKGMLVKKENKHNGMTKLN
jgi:hypothetical protein